MEDTAIVINTYKRNLELVERSVRAALQQKPEPSLVVLIDQNEVALSLVPELSLHPLLRIQRVIKNSVSSARNALVLPDSIEWIIFCDDDGYMAETYLESFFGLRLKHPALEIFAGSIVRDDNGEFYSPRHKIGGSLKFFKNTKLLMGSNFAIKRRVFDALGRFDESFGAGAFWGSGEETDFCWNAYFAGIKMEFFPELVVFHIKPYAGDFRHSVSKAFQYGRGKGALVYKWLIQNHQPLVIFEFFEMLTVPLIQIFISLFTLRFDRVAIYGVVFYSRIRGWFEAMLIN